jgi:hypothetical protein
MDPRARSVPDWKTRLINNQHIEESYMTADENINDIVYGKNSEHIGYYREWKYATGLGFMALSTKILFMYLGGLIQARKQFVPGFMYFRNGYYNWIAGSKYIIGGYLLGSLLSSFTFGQPFVLEDLFRRQLRKHTYFTVFERQEPL